MKCPFCAEEIADGAARCPSCQERLDDDAGAPPAPGGGGGGAKSVAIVLVVVLALVLGGVCLLAALLMPALTRAKTRSNRVKCANNLRQVGISALTYADLQRAFPHIRGRTELDGDVTSNDPSRAMRLLVSHGLLDSADLFVCPSSMDMAMREPFTGHGETWQWGGTEAAHSPLDALADDPTLDRNDELSFGWTRRALSGNARSNVMISADKAVQEANPRPADPMVGNHTDGWNVVSVDGTVQWLATGSSPFPGSYLAKTEGPPEAASLAIKDQDDPAALR